MSGSITQPSFLQSLSKSIAVIVLLPIILAAAYFTYHSYQDALVRAQQNVKWQAQTISLDLINKLSALHYKILSFANNPVLGEAAVNILYSQFAVNQLQSLVQEDELISAAFIADGSDFIVEGYPFETLKVDSPVFNKVVQSKLQQDVNKIDSSFVLLSRNELNLQDESFVADGDNLLFFLPLKKQMDSIVTPFKVTAGLFVLVDASALIGESVLVNSRLDQVQVTVDGRVIFEGQFRQVDTAIADSVGSSLLLGPAFNNELTVTVRNDSYVYLSEIRLAVYQTIVLFFVLVLLLSFALRYFSRRFSQPLAHLIHLSREYSRGNYYHSDFKADYHEFAELITFFNDMVSTIRGQLARLDEEKRNAQASEKLKARFLANMSHEIRTPLNGIVGLLKMIGETELSRDAKSWVNDAQITSNLLLTIVNDILDFSKIEEGKVEIEHTRFGIQQLLSGVTNGYKALLDNKNLSWQVEIAPDVANYWLGDPTRISQIIMNLVSNAVKFTETGGVALRISHERREQDFLCFQIKDTGIGMSEQQLATLFQSFQQADVSTTRKYGGTGLGLSISKKLANLMGGDIDVRSDVGVGTEFKVWVSVMEASQAMLAQQTETKVPDLSGFNLLIAEDNRINQVILSHLLRPTKATFTMVDNGQAALKQMSEQEYDLVLMDVQMPEMDGMEATVELRKSGYCGPIVMQTANVLMEEVELYLQNGANSHIAKPIVESVLYQTLDRYLVRINGAVEACDELD